MLTLSSMENLIVSATIKCALIRQINIRRTKKEGALLFL